jgi:hypothetical protein
MSKVRIDKPSQFIRPRKIILKSDMGKPVVINSISISRDGEIKLLSNENIQTPIRSNFIKYYERPKGPKILVDIPIIKDNLSTNDRKLIAKYNYLYAIDTNTKIINNKSITVSCYARFNTKTSIGDIFQPIVLINEIITEKMGWVELIRSILRESEFKTELKIAIVVDSDYGNIEKFNKRELPLINNLFLPPNFELIYASTDSGSENLPNKLITECDKIAKITYKKFK